MTNEFYTLFAEIFRKNELDAYIKDEVVGKFEELTRLLLETNAVMNVTAITDPAKIIALHYADCVAVARHIPTGSRVADIGCGGGFPLLPLAIVRPDLTLLGVDSTEKKVRFVQATADKLGLSVQTTAARAEELGQNADLRETFDVVISRAVARMNILDELTLPLVRVGGQLIAMKGAIGAEELAEASSGCVKLGGSPLPPLAYSIHTQDTSESRTLLAVEKTTPTPSAYPRPFGQIKKKPL